MLWEVNSYLCTLIHYSIIIKIMIDVKISVIRLGYFSCYLGNTQVVSKWPCINFGFEEYREQTWGGKKIIISVKFKYLLKERKKNFSKNSSVLCIWIWTRGEKIDHRCCIWKRTLGDGCVFSWVICGSLSPELIEPIT